MDLQSWTYTIAIIFMSFWILVLGMLVLIMWTLYQTIKNAPKTIEAKIVAALDEKKFELLSMFGVAAVTFLGNKLRSWFGKKE